MNYYDEYKKKLVTAKEAVSIIKDGDWIDFGWSTATPVACDKALAEVLPNLKDIKFRGGILLWVPEIFKIKNPQEHMTWVSWHMSAIERKAVEAGFCYYIPVRYSESPRYIREYYDIDVSIYQVAPMDKHGYFNTGLNGSGTKASFDTAKKVIVEVNKNMPICNGGEYSNIHISDIDYIVEGDNPPLGILPSSKASEIDEKVAQMIVEQIPDRACLQLGIGGMPNAIGTLIANSDLKDLGIHTEMYVDSFVDMSEAGKITGKYKQIDRGRQVYAFGAGTKKLYDFLDHNPECMCSTVDYVNDIRVLASLDNLISINNALNIDLFGQVAAEGVGTQHISGAGGQLDFVLGAYLSNGGKSFICLSSTFYNKKTAKLESRIVPNLENGTIVTDTRANVQYVCTEYGCVNLKGLTTWQRAEALISIAHPDFREELIEQAKIMNIWRKTNIR